MAENLNSLQEAVICAGKAAALFAKSIVELARSIGQHLAENRELMAYAWAMKNHPDWVKIHARTKKKRIRKKYHNRIMRAFREAVNNGG